MLDGAFACILDSFKKEALKMFLSVVINLQDYLLPEEYVKIMRASMLDKCPVSTYKQVCDVFLAQLGRLPNEVSQVKCGFSY